MHLFSIVSSYTFAFNVLSTRSSTTASPTFLWYTVIAGIDEEEEGSDVNGGSNGMRKKIGKDNLAPETLAGYRDYNELNDDNEINVDSYSNMAGSSFMPGFQLTALCGDD